MGRNECLRRKIRWQTLKSMKNKKLVSSESKFLIIEQYLRLRLTIFYKKIFFVSEIICLYISVYFYETPLMQTFLYMKRYLCTRHLYYVDIL